MDDDYSEYEYVEFGVKPTWHKDTFIKTSEIELNIGIHTTSPIDVYATVFRTKEPIEPKKDTMVIGDMYFDIDCEGDLEKALQDTREIVNIWTNQFDVDPDSIRITFSGNKGFHIYISYKTMGVKPNKDLHKVYERIAKGFKEVYDTIDTQVYQKNRFMRISHTIHGTTGLFAVPLTYKELMELDIDKISRLAELSRGTIEEPTIQYKEPKLSLKAKQLFDVNKERIGQPIKFKVSESHLDVDDLRNVCLAINHIYNSIEKGQHLTHHQNIFLSKVLVCYGREGEREIHRLLNISEGNDYNQGLTQYQINYSKDGICPPQCKYVRENWRLCEGCNGSTNPIEIMRKEHEVIETIKDGSTTYDILNPAFAIKKIPSYYMCEDFIIQPIILPARIFEEKKVKHGKSSNVNEDMIPFLLYQDSKNNRRIHPSDKIINSNGKRYKLYKPPMESKEMSLPSPKVVEMFLKKIKVDGCELWKDIKNNVMKYIDFMRNGEYIFETSLITATYFYYLYSAFPYQHFHGVKGSGKSRAQELFNRLAFHSIFTKGISPSALFRMIEAMGCTVIMEEAEQLWSPNKNPEMSQLLNAGNRKDGYAHRVNPNKPDFPVEAFAVYGCKSLSSINEIHYVLADRTIQISMMPTTTKKGNLKFNEDTLKEIRDKLYLLRLQDGIHFAHCSKDVNEFTDLDMSNRDREKFLPILHVCQRYGSEEDLENLKDFIKEYIKLSRSEYVDSPEATVLIALKKDLKSQGVAEAWIPVHHTRNTIIRSDPEAYRITTHEDGHEDFKITQTSETAKRFRCEIIGRIMNKLRIGYKPEHKRRLSFGIERFVTFEAVNRAIKKLRLEGEIGLLAKPIDDQKKLGV